MNNFIFKNPTKIVFGKGQIGMLSELIPQKARVMVIYGGGSVLKNGVMDQVDTALQSFEVIKFAGVEPNPNYHTLMEAVSLAKENHIDFLLAVGGGSVIDGTKFISAAIPFEGNPWSILNEQAPISEAIPFGTVLTLPATGSESNVGAVVTRKDTQDKLAFHSELVYPQFSILDPETTYTLPKRQTANGIVDAFTHVMEQYLINREHTPLQDRYAEAILTTLIEVAPQVLSNPDDYYARSTVMWAANQALNGWLSQGVPTDWATHMIGHELTALYQIDHARTLAIILPSVMQVMREFKKAKLLQYAERVWNIHVENEDEKIIQAIEKTRAFFESVDIPTHISQYVDDTADVCADKVIAQLERHGLTELGEKRNITLEISRQIVLHSY